MSIAQKQIELIEEFAMFPSWMEKYEYIIELGKDLQTLPEELKNDDHLIKGCQSRVWISASKNADGTLHFEGDSDAIITKGMVSLIVRIFEGEKGQDIVDAPMEFLKEIGLMENLSPTRSNGLAAMIKQIKTYGLLMQ
ncbi:MAG: Cysteine desulfuration protein sufE [Bacteroidota bacterium]|jgi:cysteine desulfuration protein SufE